MCSSGSLDIPSRPVAPSHFLTEYTRAVGAILAGKLCQSTGVTSVSGAHGGIAAAPHVVSSTTGAAITLMGAKGSRLKQNLELRVRAEVQITPRENRP